MAGALSAMIAAAFAGGVVSDGYFEYTTLLLPGNGTNGAQNNTFLDSSSNTFTITRNPATGPNAPTQGTFSPFSQTGWGGSFNTSTTYLTVTDTSNLRFGSSNFTIEAFVYRAASGATQTIASKGASTPTGWVFQISSADKLVFTDTSTSITGATSLAANTWYYVAVVRAGTGSNQTTLYVNAVSDATGTSATTFSQTDNMKIGADRSNTNFANGYISNLRLSNTNRTISSTPTSALTADANTIFLGLYNNRFQYTDSTAAFTNMSVTGTPSVQAFSPFNPTSSWSAVTNGGSGYFDGTGDYLTVSSNSSLAMGSGNFTIEFWFNSISAASVTTRMMSGIAVGGTFVANTWVFALNTASQGLSFYVHNYSSSAPMLASTSTTIYQDLQWHHCAVVRNGNSWAMYIDGQLQGSAVTSSVALDGGSSSPVTVGWSGIAGDANYNGYMSNLRLVKGTAVYTAAFTPPTAPLTATQSANTNGNPSAAITGTATSLLLNFTNAGIYDATSKNDLETVGGAQISTAISAKWGSGCMAFDGSGDYLFTPSLQPLGNGNFTVEFWLFPNSTFSGVFGGILEARQSANGAGLVYLGYTSTANQIGWFDNTSFVVTGSLTSSVWQHVAFVRNGSTLTMYVSGTSTASTSYTQNLTVPFRLIGSSYDNFAFNGYMQDLRITRGYARYTTNFTAPTAAFPTL
ncbi:MAG: LamG domain-containing protein [Caulobacteraceae bacterium]|nr:LamG domain-containing protein [Caulobacteraceae bacterium]